MHSAMDGLEMAFRYFEDGMQTHSSVNGCFWQSAMCALLLWTQDQCAQAGYGLERKDTTVKIICGCFHLEPCWAPRVPDPRSCHTGCQSLDSVRNRRLRHTPAAARSQPAVRARNHWGGRKHALPRVRKDRWQTAAAVIRSRGEVRRRRVVRAGELRHGDQNPGGSWRTRGGSWWAARTSPWSPAVRLSLVLLSDWIPQHILKSVRTR